MRSAMKNASVILPRRFSSFVRCQTRLSLTSTNDSYVFGSWALGATAFFVLDFLAFSEAVEVTFDRRMMKEDIASFTFNEAKAFVCQLFDGTLRHLYISQHAA